SAPQSVKFRTREVIERIQSVIRSVDTHSWLRSMPHEFGAPKADTLKADKGRTMITVYLPLALVSMWGDSTTHKSMTTEHAVAYWSYMGVWLSRLKTVHTFVDYRPNGHMVIHIHHFLLSFGPVHSWWCFPFESLISQLQHLPTNNKFGMYQLASKGEQQ
ncbi:hypothetical protein PAXINDRAFT_85099, partial [Paxillus involutus ATCC 200175]